MKRNLGRNKGFALSVFSRKLQKTPLFDAGLAMDVSVLNLHNTNVTKSACEQTSQNVVRAYQKLFQTPKETFLNECMFCAQATFWPLPQHCKLKVDLHMKRLQLLSLNVTLRET